MPLSRRRFLAVGCTAAAGLVGWGSLHRDSRGTLPRRGDLRLALISDLPAPPSGPVLEPPSLPELNWGDYSDWWMIEATGNIAQDATAAFNAGLDRVLAPGSPWSTLQFPDGDFRITGEIIKQRLSGGASQLHLRGTGNTRIIWDGPEDGTMMKVRSLLASTYMGIIWDGNNGAARGFVHDGGFDSKCLHKHERFQNFREQGSGTTQERPRMGDGYVESSEWNNCVFVNCGNGLAIYSSFGGGRNHLDWCNNIDGCEFWDNDYGVFSNEGDFFLRNSHFRRSRIADISKPDAGNRNGISIRRVTSVGSRMLYDCPNLGSPVVFQDVHVSDWTNPDGAIRYGSSHPLVIFDSSFTNAPSAGAPVRLLNSTSVVSSGNATSTPALFAGQTARVQEIPAGSRTGSVTSPYQSFFQAEARIPSRVFDARRDFGGRGAGGDDNAAIRATIEAARQHGQDAVAYFPRGDWRGSGIRITGGSYFVSGSGAADGGGLPNTLFQPLASSPSEPVFIIEDPQDIVIEQMCVRRGRNGVSIRQVSTRQDLPSKIHYQHVIAPYITSYTRPNAFTGRGVFEFENLAPGSIVTGNVLAAWREGISFHNCSGAKILFTHIGSHSQGVVRVSGTSTDRSGFFGICFGHTRYRVEDNQNFVISDGYVEQMQSTNIGDASRGPYVYLTGSGTLPSGRATFCSPGRVDARYDSSLPPYEVYFQSENYRGQISSVLQRFNYHGPTSGRGSRTAYRYDCNGGAPLDVVLLGSSYELRQPSVDGGANARQHRIACSQANAQAGGGSTAIADITSANSMALAAAALDHFRELGAMDLELRNG
jgi:hypothetical protein